MTQETQQSDGTIDMVPGSTDIRATIARLDSAQRDVLATEWRKAYRCDPPRGASRQFLFAAVAHALQLKHHGISATKLRRRLERHERRPGSAPKPTQKLAPGTRLIREWNGSTHTVDVTDDGYRWNGEHFRSLSAIARTITGTRWSGPRFFGLDREELR